MCHCSFSISTFPVITVFTGMFWYVFVVNILDDFYNLWLPLLAAERIQCISALFVVYFYTNGYISGDAVMLRKWSWKMTRGHHPHIAAEKKHFLLTLPRYSRNRRPQFPMLCRNSTESYYSAFWKMHHTIICSNFKLLKICSWLFLAVRRRFYSRATV